MAAYRKGWWPGKRTEQLFLANDWIEVIGSQGSLWGIPQEDVTALTTQAADATALLEQCRTSERTPVLTAQCNESFRVLKELMTAMKNRYFHCPPLTSVNLTALLLYHDEIPTPIPAPGAVPTGDLFFPGVGMIEIRRIRPVDPAIGDPRSNDGARIWFGLEGAPTDSYPYRIPAGTEVKSGRILPNSVFTERSKERFLFPGESGNRVHICMQFEHRGLAGPWGPVLSAVIP